MRGRSRRMWGRVRAASVSWRRRGRPLARCVRCRAIAPENLAAQVRRRIAESPAYPRLGWARVRRRVALAPALGLLTIAAWWGWQAQQTNAPVNTTAEDPTESLVALHEQLEAADWAPSPTPSYFISTGYTR